MCKTFDIVVYIYSHRAGGGDKKIFSRKINVSHITSRTNSKRNTYPSMCYIYLLYVTVSVNHAAS